MIRRLSGIVLGGVLVAVFGLAAPAVAHVTVSPEEATAGGYARVVFRVPNERDDASTVKVEVHIPETYAIPSVRTMPVPGWKVEVTTTTPKQKVENHGVPVDKLVSQIVWTPTSPEHAIAPGTFMEFPISLGPLPEEPQQLLFTAVQTYDSGEVVRWEEEPTDGAQRPAPALTLTPAEEDEGHGSDTGGAEDAAAAAENEKTSGGTPLWLGVAGLVAGLVGAVLGGVALVTSRRAAADAASGNKQGGGSAS